MFGTAVRTQALLLDSPVYDLRTGHADAAVCSLLAYPLGVVRLQIMSILDRLFFPFRRTEDVAEPSLDHDNPYRERDGLTKVRNALLTSYPRLVGPINRMMDGYEIFAKTGETPVDAYHAFRELYISTKGQSNKVIGENVSRKFPAVRLTKPVKSIFGEFTLEQVAEAADSLKRSGLYRLPKLLPKDVVEQIRDQLHFAADRGDLAVTQLPELGRTTFGEESLLPISSAMDVAADPFLRHTAGQALGTSPVLGFVISWISRAHGNDAATMSAAAQLFHFDMSNPRFIKTFVYLTDVENENGPHCMVPRSHERRPDHLWKDGRITDEEIAASYRPEEWETLTGRAGSTFMVDTSAFHKGLAVDKGDRHILQIYYVDTLFGEHVTAPTAHFNYSNYQCTPRFWSRYIAQ